MPASKPLSPEQLARRCDLARLPFQSTAELEDLTEIIGQERAMGAVRFGTDIRRDGYNLFVLGPPGMGKHTLVRQYLDERASREETPTDWCYVNNFQQAHKPFALRLPAGRGTKLKSDMEQLVDELRTSIPALFETEEYRARRDSIRDELNERQETAFKQLGDDSAKQGIALLQTPDGFALAPMHGEEVINPDDYEKLPDSEKQRIQKLIAEFQERLQKIIRQIPLWRREARDKVRRLNREITLSAVGHSISDIKAKYTDLPEVTQYLDNVQQDILDHADEFRTPEGKTVEMAGLQITETSSYHRYRVNVVVDHEGTKGAPVILDDHPMYGNLVGRVEHISQLGALITDFTLIKAGSLHQANGGYLLLDAHKVLTQPFAWEGLKRALQSREIRIESLGQILSLVSTVSLEPEPIPLDLKIIMFGDRLLYYLLCEYDPEFDELFKVSADFDDTIEWNEQNDLLYARLIATLARREKLLPFDGSAVARVIEHGARIAGDAEKLSTHLQSIADLLRESDYWGRKAGGENVSASHVEEAIVGQLHRNDRLRSRLQEEIIRNTILIDTSGQMQGQVNALSVIELGNFPFAIPTRVTATTRLGEGDLVNIEREVELSGAIHSKGVLILSSFLASRYSRNQPLSLSASLVFEQSYGMVEGDSASLAELCALLSSLSGMPIRQSLAITGSVNQFGQAQAIGAVNEKIEGFFDICKARGLDGTHGVLIPTANIKHLMLRPDVVAAAREGQFHVHAVENIDQAMELLTGMAAGEPDEQGNLPQDSINYLVATRMFELTMLRQAFSATQKTGKDGKKHG